MNVCCLYMENKGEKTQLKKKKKKKEEEEASPASLKNDVWNAWKIIKNKHLQRSLEKLKKKMHNQAKSEKW